MFWLDSFQTFRFAVNSKIIPILISLLINVYIMFIYTFKPTSLYPFLEIEHPYFNDPCRPTSNENKKNNKIEFSIWIFLMNRMNHFDLVRNDKGVESK